MKNIRIAQLIGLSLIFIISVIGCAKKINSNDEKKTQTNYGFSWEYEDNDHSLKYQPIIEVKYYLSKNKIRWDLEPSKISYIITVNPEKIYMLFNDSKTYRETNKEEYMNTLAMSTIVSRQIAPYITTSKEETDQTIGNYKCIKYITTFEGRKSEFWISNDIKDFDKYCDYLSDFKKVFGSFPELNPFKDNYGNEYANYILVKGISNNTEITLKKFEITEINDSIFDIPSGYRLKQ